ncbi:MAG: E3 ubiquitin--protein ligase, partial [Serratia liquefaciens]|nr:E3 ubiquitin--protein ligase [Serratia liquefaciens]
SLPSGLTELYASNNFLTRLPPAIAHLSAQASINITYNSLSDATLQELWAMIRASGYSGPRIFFSTNPAPSHKEVRALHLAVADWLIPAQKEVADSWMAFEQEECAAPFSRFLDVLRYTENFRKNSDFKAWIAGWLAELADNQALRGNTFFMARESTSSCEDKVTLALHLMQNVRQRHKAENGEFDHKLPALVAIAREMFRLEKIERIAQHKLKALYGTNQDNKNHSVDEVEVYLGYQNRLRVPLELTTMTPIMRFFEVSSNTESDLQSAEIQVKSAENSQFREWILQWEPLHKVLERIEPDEWATISAMKWPAYEEALEKLRQNVPDDMKENKEDKTVNEEIQNAIAVEALKIAENTVWASLAPLVESKLAGLLNTKWSSIEPTPPS